MNVACRRRAFAAPALAPALALTCILAGCTGSVARSPSLAAAREDLLERAPAEWAASPSRGVEPSSSPHPGEPVAVDWWKDFRDPQLDALIVEALASNHDLEAAAARVVVAQAEARISGADLYPSLRLGGNAGRSRQVYVGLPIPQTENGSSVLASTATQYGVSLDLSWEIDLWGRLRSADAAARAQAQAALILYEGARLSLAGQTAKAWFALVDAKEQLALAETTLATFRSAAEQVRARYARGVRSPLDLRLALTQEAGAEARVAERRALLERTARQLEVLLGRYPAAEIARTASSSSAALVSGERAEVPVGVPAELLSRRPDLAAAAYRVYASDKRIDSAKAALLPRIAITGRAGTISDDVSDLLDGDFGVWTIASNLVQPIFEGGRLRAGVARAKGAAAEAGADYATAALQAFAEVESALADERHVAAIVAALEAATEQSVAAEELATQRYRSGLESYVTVLAAQRSALDSQSTLLDARRLLLDNRIDLHLALGGGFTDPELQATQPPSPTAELPVPATPSAIPESAS